MALNIVMKIKQIITQTVRMVVGQTFGTMSARYSIIIFTNVH